MLVNLLYALTVAIKKIVANGIQTLETPKTFGTKNEAKKKSQYTYKGINQQ